MVCNMTEWNNNWTKKKFKVPWLKVKTLTWGEIVKALQWDVQ